MSEIEDKLKELELRRITIGRDMFYYQDIINRLQTDLNRCIAEINALKGEK